MKTTGYNDIDLKNWKEYSDVRTDTFWNHKINLFKQLRKRYTKKNDNILGLFHNEQNLSIELLTSEDHIKIDYEDNQNFSETLKKIEKIQFIIFEPAFHYYVADNDINNFYKIFEQTAKESLKLLEENRFVALITGDVYSNSTLDLMGFKCVEFLKTQGLKLKSVVIKEIKKESVEHKLFRYRALTGGFNIINHYYVFILQKSS